jgi:hypothetical protein
LKLDVGATLSRVFELYGKQAGILLPAALLVFIPIVILIAIITAIVLSSVGPSLTTMTDYSQVDPAQLQADLAASVLPLTILGFVTLAVMLVGTYWYQGIVVNAVADMEDGKQDHTLGSLFSASMPFIGPLIGAGLLVGLAIIGIGIVIAVISSIIPALAIIVSIIGAVVIVWLVIRWVLISPAIVVEKKSVGQAFGRSSELVEGNWWRVLGVVVVIGILAAIVTYILTAILGGIGGATVGQALAQLVTQTLTAPLAGLAAAVIFFQLRAGSGAVPAGDAPPAAAPPVDAPPPPAAEPPPPPPPPAGPAA